MISHDLSKRRPMNRPFIRFNWTKSLSLSVAIKRLPVKSTPIQFQQSGQFSQILWSPPYCSDSKYSATQRSWLNRFLAKSAPSSLTMEMKSKSKSGYLYFELLRLLAHVFDVYTDQVSHHENYMIDRIYISKLFWNKITLSSHLHCFLYWQ